MSEAVEYRLKRNRIAALEKFGEIEYLLGLACVGVSAALVGVGYPDPDPALRGGVWLLGSAGVASLIRCVTHAYHVRSACNDGYCRRFAEWSGVDIADPPLDEWEDELEEAGAFMGGAE